ncbi:putative UDP-glucose 6-dehydrogenase [Rosellinia necatrix]|uniref:UDP-glucose 6-dehydrogenase n=1 Tax=Rosellinia necatrix TaxID=77044 RepID=A0A1S8A8G5_ROSNE|nr:putative UDP-glucose 6-dehydrogenase [Rosellinia necatrix]
MLAQRVSSINSISAICEETGADVGEVGRAVGSDARIGGAFLRAGLGFGGSCFKKDVLSLAYLADSVGLAGVAEYWRQVVAMNEDQRDRFSRRVVRCLNNTLVGKKLTFLGYAFKANTSDVRESPTSDVVRRLLSERPREIAIFDPCCDPAVVRRDIGMILQDPSVVGRGACPVVVYSDVYEACEASNAVIVTTECDQFRNKEPKAALCPARRKSRDRFDVGRFTRQGQSGMDILDCHGPFLWSSPVLAHEGEDPLPGLAEEPSCDEDCPECEAIKMGGRKAGGHGAAENVDWHKIAYRMTKPKWLFDGRGIIDAEEMAKLDVHVEIIGSQGKA